MSFGCMQHEEGLRVYAAYSTMQQDCYGARGRLWMVLIADVQAANYRLLLLLLCSYTLFFTI
jgi:hypothetical protein